MDVIRTVAWYEFKLILRSRVFRLFALLTAIVQIAMVVLFYLIPNFSRWGLRAVPSILPYSSTLLYGMFSAVGGIFVATECLGRDISLGTTDTVYYRNFSAPAYMAGKGIGIMMAMLGLMFTLMLMPLTVNLFFLPDTPTTLESYLLYPVLITIPALLFTMGLSWLVMLITRSQAVSFMVMVFVFGATLWANRFIGLHHLLDYPGLRIPALYSEFIGFGDAGRFFMQRGLYALLGIGMMAAAPLMLPRLPQSQTARRVSGALAVVLIVTASFLSVTYFSAFAGDHALRDELRVLNHTFGSHPRPTMTASDLNVEHSGDTITAEAALSLRNDTTEPLDTYLFSLNPDLVIESITDQSGALPFERTQHLITVTPQSALAPGDSTSLVIAYAGTINDRICYLDTPEAERTDSFALAFMPIQRMSGIIDPDCVLLTPETLWYPVAGVPYGTTFPDLGRKDFPRFTMTVSTEPGMVPVSQGVPDTLADGRIAFAPETLLSQLSLNIAPYQRQAAEVDSITYAAYMLPGHDYYTSFLEKYKEGLPEYIRQEIERFETMYYSSYPFDSFTIVEVPIQFSPRPRVWTIAQDNMQPGVVLMNERGAFMRDITSLMRSIERIMGQISEDQLNQLIMNNTINTVYGESYNIFTDGSSSNSLPSIFSMSTLYQIISISDDVVYNIFPNYFSFTNNYYSDQWPIINTMMERYLALQRYTNSRVIGADAFSPTDRANMLLSQYSLAEILSMAEHTDLMNIILSAKMSQLLASFSAKIGGERFDERFKEELAGSRFTPVAFSALLDAIQEGSGEELASFLDDWYYASELPICRLCDVEHVEIHENEQTFYQLMVTLSNPSTADGLVRLSTMSLELDEQTGRGDLHEIERFVELPAGESRCVCMVADNPFYSGVSVNTLVSQNLPAMFQERIPDPEEDLTVTLQDTVLVVEQEPERQEPGVIIVDDTSPGCVATTGVEPTWFQKLVYGKKDESEYRPVMLFSPYNEWVRSIDAEFYGDHIRSGLVKAPGSGDMSVTWTAQLPESGTYDVYAHTTMTMSGVYISISRDGTPQSTISDLHYTIHHDDGEDAIEIELSRGGDEWSFLGSFYFSAGDAKVELSDESEGRMVFADAIKWVKR